MKTSTKFGKRKTADKPRLSPKIQYFLSFEGSSTEVKYFNGINAYRDSIGISDTIKINIVERHVYNRGCSHPKQVYLLLIQHLKEHDSGITKADAIALYFNDWFHKQPNAPRCVDVGKVLLSYLSGAGLNINSDNIDEKLLEICVDKVLDEYLRLSSRFTDFQKYLQKERRLGYRKGDKACMIIDRDPESFKSDQYENILKICKNCKEFSMNVYVTNPRFEFWILLHFLKSEEIDTNMRKKIMEKRLDGQEPYLESLVHAYLPSFSKRNLPFEDLRDKVTTAISNEKGFCEDIYELKEKLGSNIGSLLSEMITKKSE